MLIGTHSSATALLQRVQMTRTVQLHSPINAQIEHFVIVLIRGVLSDNVESRLQSLPLVTSPSNRPTTLR